MTDGTADPTARARLLPWVLSAVFLALIALAVVLWSRFGTEAGLVASPLIGQQVPDVALPYLEQDGSLSLRDVGGDVVVVNFWASWCLPCRDEHPALTSAAARYSDAGVRFVGILYQDRESAGVEFLDRYGRGYEYVMDEESRAAIEFGVFGIPETFFVDRAGTVVGKVSGAVSTELLTRTIDAILLGEDVESVRSGPVQNAPDG